MSEGIFHLEDYFKLHNVNLIIIFFLCLHIFSSRFYRKNARKEAMNHIILKVSFIQVMTLNTIS